MHTYTFLNILIICIILMLRIVIMLRTLQTGLRLKLSCPLGGTLPYLGLGCATRTLFVQWLLF